MTPFFQYTPNALPDHPVVNSLAKRLANLSDEAKEAARQFPMRLPVTLAKRIPWDQDGPLSKEFLPADEEFYPVLGYSTDPLAEKNAEIMPGLIRKYQGRVLLRLSTQCAVHCRFCFRRHRATQDIPKNLHEWEPALGIIAEDVTLREVIFSGGDPLTLTDRRLSALTTRLAAIPHLTRLRVHTRMPVFTPERVTPALIQWLKSTRLTPMMVIHVNCPEELDQSALLALGRLVDGGIPVLNQSVLLKGINDHPDTLTLLYETLINARVIPYYLHMLDQVFGSAHFYVDKNVALDIMTALRNRLPGYAVPRLVREFPGELSKRPVGI